ncbi:S-adenosylmethionine-dependent methyltransferase Rv2258c-like [Babylonia areolata]|uniref:S-adenosylmethionine-dependent methyltransferase Rv2258c-like n=1 Tax=Babylonia areolata TaxID=304850 RepID=UPI003FD5B89D
MEDSASYERLANDVYVYGSVSLAMAMATETKMVDCLCTAQSPLTSADMAGQLKLKERYVGEILNSLTAIGLVQLEAGTGGKEGKEARFWVPPSCRKALKKAAVDFVMVSSSAKQYADVRKCIDQDGPSYVESRFDSESSDDLDEWGIAYLDCITEGILETPGLKERLEKGIKAVEVGCGTGRLFLHFAALFPNSHFTLTELDPKPLEEARRRAEEEGLTNVTFQTLDVMLVPDELKESADWLLTCNVIYNLSGPLEALRGIRKALKRGGQYSLVDMFLSSFLADNVNDKAAAALYGMGAFNCIPSSEQQSGSAEALDWGAEKAMELVEAAGMKVLGLTRSKAMNTTAVCMCQKPN